MDFAIYRGDEFLFMGTKYECAAFLGMTPKMVVWYSSPAVYKRQSRLQNGLIIIRLERENENE